MSARELFAWPDWGTGLVWFWIGSAYEGWHLGHFSWWEAPFMVAFTFATVAAIVVTFRAVCDIATRRRGTP